jgi:hypothetical protein
MRRLLPFVRGLALAFAQAAQAAPRASISQRSVSPTAGVITEFTIPTASSLPNFIAAGPDGNLWFTESAEAANKIGRITPTGTFTELAPVQPASPARLDGPAHARPEEQTWPRSSTMSGVQPASPVPIHASRWAGSRRDHEMAVPVLQLPPPLTSVPPNHSLPHDLIAPSSEQIHVFECLTDPFRPKLRAANSKQ